jgi:centromeric protein E
MSAVRFVADHLHLPPAPTEELFNKVVSPLVSAAMDGYDGTVFAYGSESAPAIKTDIGETELIKPGRLFAQ